MEDDGGLALVIGGLEGSGDLFFGLVIEKLEFVGVEVDVEYFFVEFDEVEQGRVGPHFYFLFEALT